MKKTLSLLLLTLGLSLVTGNAKDFKFPEPDDVLFTITIPDAWAPKLADDGTLEAEDKEGHSYLAIWEEENKTELAKIAGDIDEILSEYATEVKLLNKPESYTLAGLTGLLFKGTAKDKEDGSGIGFEAIILPVSKDRAAVIYFDYSQDAPKSVVNNLVKILESFKPTPAP